MTQEEFEAKKRDFEEILPDYLSLSAVGQKAFKTMVSALRLTEAAQTQVAQMGRVAV